MFSDRGKLVAVAIIVFAAVLRFRGIERWSLNNDEISEARWSARSFRGMMQEVRRDAVHPPLDYFVQFAVGRIGPPWVRRVPPVLFGVATVALTIFLGASWYSPLAGLAAGFLLSISPNHVRHSQEVRPYSMGIFFILAALAALEWYARSGRRRWAVVWFASVFLAGATLYFAGMLAFVASVTRILIGRRKDLAVLWHRLPLMIVAWQVLYLPWIPVIARVAGSPSTLAAEKLDRFWWLYRAQVLGTGDWIPEPVTRGSIAFWIAVALGILVSVRSRKLLVATSWFAGGSALTILLLHIHPHFETPRYFCPPGLALSCSLAAESPFCGDGITRALSQWRLSSCSPAFQPSPCRPTIGASALTGAVSRNTSMIERGPAMRSSPRTTGSIAISSTTGD